ncbi:MAG: M28 family peptidase [Gemmatimonadota bacterium]|nr:M28 family peptidase [Gemmatimonadota bacterium]
MRRRGTRIARALWLASVLGACDDTVPPGARVDRPSLSGEAAFERVRTQLDFGPRVPGQPGHAAQLAWMQAELAPLADTVVLQPFDAVTTSGDTLRLTNVIARFQPEATRRLLLLTHWDTRPRSDQASDPAQRDIPVPGANDGASGTAILLELAGLLATQAPPVGVDLLFVDGEDYGPTTADMFFGSRHYAATLPDDAHPVYAVLLDMVGDVDPSFPIEGYSADAARDLALRVWGVARDLGYEPWFPTRVGIRITDDHLPLLEKGIRAIDVIDFDYGPRNSWWHTPQDDLSHVSAATLGMVGEVVAEWVYRGG